MRTSSAGGVPLTAVAGCMLVALQAEPAVAVDVDGTMPQPNMLGQPLVLVPVYANSAGDQSKPLSVVAPMSTLTRWNQYFGLLALRATSASVTDAGAGSLPAELSVMLSM